MPHLGRSSSDPRQSTPIPPPGSFSVRGRAATVGTAAPIGNHSFRATGVTAYLANGGALEYASKMAAHEGPRETRPHDRTRERLNAG
jgi:hypothetical protein